jgi:hypothetical protein
MVRFIHYLFVTISQTQTFISYLLLVIYRPPPQVLGVLKMNYLCGCHLSLQFIIVHLLFNKYLLLSALCEGTLWCITGQKHLVNLVCVRVCELICS